MTVPLTIDPRARLRYNKRAADLVSELQAIPQLRPSGKSFQPIVHAESIGESDILEVPGLGLVDGCDRWIGRYFILDGCQIGLVGSAWTRFEDLVSRIFRTPSVSSAISKRVIANHLFRWIQSQFLGNQVSDDACGYIVEKASPGIRDYEVWIPVSCTYVEHGFGVGRVRLRTISEEVIESWRLSATPEDPSLRDVVDQLFQKHRKELLGLAACVSTHHAECERAEELALEWSEEAIMLLRVFSPAHLIPQLRSYTTLLGDQPVRTTTVIALGPERKPLWTQRVIDIGSPRWTLSTEEICEIRDVGLDALTAVVRKPSLTSFERDALSALRLYSRSAIARDLEERLVFVFAALESLLLRDASEPIQQNMAERLAWLAGTEFDSRKRIRSVVRDAYALRSRFFHHGRRIAADETVISEFLQATWIFFTCLWQLTAKYPDRLALLQSIDDAKLGAPPTRGNRRDDPRGKP